MAEQSEGKELAVELPKLPVLSNPEELHEIFSANLEGMTPSFQAIKIPSGGGLLWMLPSEDEEPEAARELQGVIIDHYAARAYWPEKIGSAGGSGVPPKCASLDAKTGSLPRNEDGEFGECKTCKWSQWGTATNAAGAETRGQACKKIHRVYIWLAGKDGILPYLLSLPPTSGERKYDGSFQTYTVKLSSKMKALPAVRTRVRLKADKNKDGVDYAAAQFFMVGDLTEPEKKQAKFLRDALRPAMRSKPFDFGETEEPDDTSDIIPEGNPGTLDGREKEKDPWDK